MGSIFGVRSTGLGGATRVIKHHSSVKAPKVSRYVKKIKLPKQKHIGKKVKKPEVKQKTQPKVAKSKIVIPKPIKVPENKHGFKYDKYHDRIYYS